VCVCVCVCMYVCVCVCVRAPRAPLSASMAYKDERPWNSQALQKFPLHNLCWWMGWSIIHLLLCYGCHASMHQTYVVRYCCSTRVTTLQFSIKVFSSWFSFFNQSFPLSNSNHIHRSFAIHFSKHPWWMTASHLQQQRSQPLAIVLNAHQYLPF
jgi:hypothetical protein